MSESERLKAELGLSDISVKIDLSPAPSKEWQRRSADAIRQANDLILYAHICAKSGGDLKTAGETERVGDILDSMTKRLETKYE